MALDPPVTATEAGAIPFRLWIGVTGHRALVDQSRLEALTDQALREIRRMLPSRPHTEVALGVISPLAEGADRLVAAEVLKDPNGILEVPLPLPVDEYVQDFTSEESRREFRDLLAHASTVTELPATDSRELAYRQVGDEVVDRCDVLIAVWDGAEARGEGGTAEVVARARGLVPVLWVPASGEGDVRVIGPPISTSGLDELERFNRERIDPDRFATERARQRADLLTGDPSVLERLSVAQYVDWVIPYLVRADQVALRFQTRFRRLFVLVIVLALLAVGAVACGAAFSSLGNAAAWIEFGLLVTVGAIVVAGRRAHLHDRWISARFLAERLRSGCMLAVSGVRRRPGDLERGSPGRREGLEWVGRAFTEVWRQQPAVDGDRDIGALRQYLSGAWVESQRQYHEKERERCERNHRVVEVAVVALFVLTGVAALLHGLHAFEIELAESEPLIFAAIVLPGLAGALGAIEIDREFVRNGDRYAETARRLEDADRGLSSAADLPTVQARVVSIEELLDRENRDWYAVMKFHDFEPPA